MSVTSCHPAQDPAAGNGGVHHGDHVLQLRLEHADIKIVTIIALSEASTVGLPVEIGRTTNANKAIGICQFGKDPDFIIVFETCSYHRHRLTVLSLKTV